MSVSTLQPDKVFKLFALALLASLAAACSGSGGQTTGSTCPSDSTLTYETFGQSFINSYCAACHSGREQPTLSSLSAIQAHLDEIDRVAAAGPNAVNTAMPQGGSLPDAERQKLGEWLACGAP